MLPGDFLFELPSFLQVFGSVLFGGFFFELNLLSDFEGMSLEHGLSFPLNLELLFSLYFLLSKNELEGVSFLLGLLGQSSLFLEHLELAGLEELLLDSLLRRFRS